MLTEQIIPQDKNLIDPDSFNSLNLINQMHTNLSRGLIWAIYTVNLAVWLWPDQIYEQACGVDNRAAYQDLGIQIFIGTTLIRSIAFPLLKKTCEVIAESYETNYSINKISEVIEVSLMEAAGIFVYIGGNPLLQQVIASKYMSIIPAGILSAIPLGKLSYKLFIDNSFYRGALQNYRSQFSNPGAYISLTFSESIAKAAMMGSLALKLTESIINTTIDAMLINNLPNETVNVILGSSMSIASVLGMLSVMNPSAWMMVNAAAAAMNVLFSSYNFPLSVISCVLPNQLNTVPGYINGGWTWAFASMSVGLSYFALPTAIKNYQNIYQSISNFRVTGQELETPEPTNHSSSKSWLSSGLESCFNCCYSFFNSPTTLNYTENSALVINSKQESFQP